MADKNLILIIDKYGRKVYKDTSEIPNINAVTLNSLPPEVFMTSMTPEKQWVYRVQGNLTLNKIEYPLYVLDGSMTTTTLTLPLPLAVEQGTIITLLNPTKDIFTINGNGVNIVRSGVESSIITLTEYQSIKLILLDIGKDHDTLWYELISIPAGVGGYTHPSTHPATMITEDTSKNFVSATEKGNIHAPRSDDQDLSGKVDKVTGSSLVSNTEITKLAGIASGAQKNSDITQAEIEAKLIGVIVTHSHAGGTDPFATAKLVLVADKPTGANVTPVTLGLSFVYEANSRYIIDIYAIVAPAAATTGCGFMIDVSTVVTFVGTFISHQLAVTGTISGAHSAGDLATASSGVSSGMVLAGNNFVYGGGILITGANPGTATFFFRSETTAVTTCKAGTCIRVMKMI